MSYEVDRIILVRRYLPELNHPWAVGNIGCRGVYFAQCQPTKCSCPKKVRLDIVGGLEIQRDRILGPAVLEYQSSLDIERWTDVISRALRAEQSLPDVLACPMCLIMSFQRNQNCSARTGAFCDSCHWTQPSRVRVLARWRRGFIVAGGIYEFISHTSAVENG